MSLFDKREKSEETGMVLEAKDEFKVAARRNKLLGLWVAEKVGKTGEAAEVLSHEIIKSDMEEVGDDDVFRKVKQVLISAGVDIDDKTIRDRMDVFLTEARAQILAEN